MLFKGNADETGRFLIEWRSQYATQLALRQETIDAIVGTVEDVHFPGALLPLRVHGDVTGILRVYVLGDVREWQRMVPLLTAAVGVTLSTFSGTQHDLDASDPFENWLMGWGFDRTGKFEVSHRQIHGDYLTDLVRDSITRLRATLRDAPSQASPLSTSTDSLLDQFYMEVTHRNEAGANAILAHLVDNYRIDTLNAAFLQVHLLAVLHQWRTIVELPTFPDLVNARRPANVTDALADALARSSFDPWPGAILNPDALDRYRRDIGSQAGTLLASGTVSFRSSGACLLSLLDAQSRGGDSGSLGPGTAGRFAALSHSWTDEERQVLAELMRRTERLLDDGSEDHLRSRTSERPIPTVASSETSPISSPADVGHEGDQGAEGTYVPQPLDDARQVDPTSPNQGSSDHPDRAEALGLVRPATSDDGPRVVVSPTAVNQPVGTSSHSGETQSLPGPGEPGLTDPVTSTSRTVDLAKSIAQGTVEATVPIVQAIIAGANQSGTVKDASATLAAVGILSDEEQETLEDDQTTARELGNLRGRAVAGVSPGSWTDWVHALSRLSPSQARAAALEGRSAWALDSDDDMYEQADELAEAIDTAAGHSSSQFLAGLPALVDQLQCARDAPRREHHAIYASLLNYLLIVAPTDRASRQALITIVDGCLNTCVDEDTFRRFVGDIGDFCIEKLTRANVEWAVELTEQVVVVPTFGSVVRDAFWNKSVGALLHLTAHIPIASRALMRQLADELGVLGAHDALLSSPGNDEEGPPVETGPERRIQAHVGIYGRDLAVNKRIRATLGRLFPRITVEIDDSVVANPRLEGLARRADVMIMYWQAASHPATEAIERARADKPFLVRPPARGAACAVRLAAEALREFSMVAV